MFSPYWLGLYAIIIHSPRWYQIYFQVSSYLLLILRHVYSCCPASHIITLDSFSGVLWTKVKVVVCCVLVLAAVGYFWVVFFSLFHISYFFDSILPFAFTRVSFFGILSVLTSSQKLQQKHNHPLFYISRWGQCLIHLKCLLSDVKLPLLNAHRRCIFV